MIPCVSTAMHGELEQQRGIDTEAAAKFLGVTPHYMIRLRHERRGPKYFKLARNVVRYRLADLHAFIEEHVVAGSEQ
jgi:hypothetical protein